MKSALIQRMNRKYVWITLCLSLAYPIHSSTHASDVAWRGFINATAELIDLIAQIVVHGVFVCDQAWSLSRAGSQRTRRFRVVYSLLDMVAKW